MTISLKQALQFSSFEQVNGYQITEYAYPTDPGTTVRLEIDDGSGDDLEFDLNQMIELHDGIAEVADVDGDRHTIEFFISRPMTEADTK